MNMSYNKPTMFSKSKLKLQVHYTLGLSPKNLTDISYRELNSALYMQKTYFPKYKVFIVSDNFVQEYEP